MSGPIAVLAGTPVDTRMGVDCLADRGLQGLAFPLSAEPRAQTAFQHAPQAARQQRVLELPEGLQVVELSARTGEGLDRLEEAVAALFPRESGTPYGQMLTNQRQEEATGRARAAVHRAREALEAGVTPDALLTDVEEALAALGELTGQSVREDITDRIFSRCCVGK